jgi:hypothetical protein
MKVLILLSLLTSLSYADADKSENLDQLKSMISGNIDQHISLLQNFKSCIQSATGREQLQDCRKSNKEAMEKFRAENKDERKSFKEEMKAKREEKKASKEKKQ